MYKCFGAAGLFIKRVPFYATNMHNASHTLSRSVSSFPFRFRLSPGSLRSVIVLEFEIRITVDTNTYDDDDVGKK